MTLETAVVLSQQPAVPERTDAEPEIICIITMTKESLYLMWAGCVVVDTFPSL